MKKASLKIVSAILAILVLFSTFSFTVEKHFCGEFLMDISFTGDIEKCEMDHSKEIKSNCCKDEVVKVEGQDVLHQQVIQDYDFKTQQVLFAFVYTFIKKDQLSQKEENFLEDFPPPDISTDFQVTLQCFLI